MVILDRCYYELTTVVVVVLFCYGGFELLQIQLRWFLVVRVQKGDECS